MPFSQEAADRAINFIQLLKHTKGEWAGEPFVLLDWQREIMTEVFGTLRPDGCRQYKYVYIEVPKKQGKSELGAGVGLYLEVADEEPGAEVYSAAADRDQAAIVFNVAMQMVDYNRTLRKILRVIPSTRRIIHPATSSVYRVLSSDVKNKHGFNSHGVIFDELHAQPNRDLYDVLTKYAGDARRQPLFWIMTTAGYDKNSICWEVHERARQVKENITPNPSFYPVLYNLPEGEDWKDEKNWYKVNPSLDHIIGLETVRQACQDAIDNPLEENTFRRLRLNQWTAQSVRWLPLDKWDACGNTIGETQGRYCYAGLDLSSNIDLTALVMLFPIEDETSFEVGGFETRYDLLAQFWIPEENMRERERKDKVPYDLWVKQGYVTATPGDVIDYERIRTQINSYGTQFDIKEIAFDRWGAVDISQKLSGDGFTIIPFGQGFQSMGTPTNELMRLTLAGAFNHGGNPVLRWNADNLVCQQNAAGFFKPDKEKATQKIDGMVALIMAIDRASRHQTKASKYEEEGLMILGGEPEEEVEEEEEENADESPDD